MSNGGVLDGESVVSFTPGDGWQLTYVGDGPLDPVSLPELVVPIIGWAVVVVRRDQWVTTTELVPVSIAQGLVQTGHPAGWSINRSETDEDTER